MESRLYSVACLLVWRRGRAPGGDRQHGPFRGAARKAGNVGRAPHFRRAVDHAEGERTDPAHEGRAERTGDVPPSEKPGGVWGRIEMFTAYFERLYNGMQYSLDGRRGA